MNTGTVAWLLAILAAAGPASASAAADLAVTMSADRLTVQPGASGLDLVTFTVTAANNGPDLAAAVVTDALPAALRIPAGMSAVATTGSYDPASGIWDIGNLNPGQQATLQIPAQALAGSSGCIMNNASIIGDAGATDPDPDNNSASATVGAPACADLVLASSRNDDVSVTCLDAIQTFHVTNQGPNAATTARLVITRYEVTSPADFSERSCSGGTVDVPGPKTVDLGTIAPGETKDYVTGLLNLQHDGPDIIVAYDVQATAAEPDPDTADNREASQYTVNRLFTISDINGSTCVIVSAFTGSSLERGIPLLRQVSRPLPADSPGRPCRGRWLLPDFTRGGRAPERPRVGAPGGPVRIDASGLGLHLSHDKRRHRPRDAPQPAQETRNGAGVHLLLYRRPRAASKISQ